MTAVDSVGLDPWRRNKFDNFLVLADKSLASGKTNDACTALRDFIGSVNQEAAKKTPQITPTEATRLIDAADVIRALAGCS